MYPCAKLLSTHVSKLLCVRRAVTHTAAYLAAQQRVQAELQRPAPHLGCSRPRLSPQPESHSSSTCACRRVSARTRRRAPLCSARRTLKCQAVPRLGRSLLLAPCGAMRARTPAGTVAGSAPPSAGCACSAGAKPLASSVRRFARRDLNTRASYDARSSWCAHDLGAKQSEAVAELSDFLRAVPHNATEDAPAGRQAESVQLRECYKRGRTIGAVLKAAG